LLQAALDLAAEGLPVFPCNKFKKPSIRKEEGGNGLHDASTDPAEVSRLFTLAGHRAALIGVPTGIASGIDVLDFDPRHGSDTWRNQFFDQLPYTRVHGTPGIDNKGGPARPGEHWLFAHVDGVRNDQGGTIGPGVDIRGEGGYVIFPPSPGYHVINNADIAEWPSWLLDKALKPEKQSPACPYTAPRQLTDQPGRRFSAYCDKLLANVREAKNGQKHDTLLRNARALGGIIAAASIGEGDAHKLLMNALPPNVEDWDSASKTAMAGLKHGQSAPFKLEDRDYLPKAFDLELSTYRHDNPANRNCALRSSNSFKEILTPKSADNPELIMRPSEGDDTDFNNLLAARTSATTLIKRTLPKVEPLLGSLVTRTSRVFLVGSTGTGKTMLAMAIAAGIAAGDGFLNWQSSRPARVLYIDGEMSMQLLQERAADALSRVSPGAADLLHFISWQEADELGIGQWAPFNTHDGQRFVLRLCTALNPDVVIFDNVMSLIEGDQKDEVPWSNTWPLVAQLTARHIGQIWLDHTGHNSARQYGSSTKSWKFATVGVMTPLARDKIAAGETGFTLSFDQPHGKARNRTPATWQDYNTVTACLKDGVWSTSGAKGGRQASKLTKKEHGWLVDLEDMFAHSDEAKICIPVAGMREVRTLSRDQVRAGFRSKGRFTAGPTENLTDKDRTALHHYLNALKNKRKIGMTEDLIWLV
jgi:hypothetical protein